MDKKKLEDLPPSYTNLGFDGESVAGPSAPKIQEAENLQEGVVGPSAPTIQETENFQEELRCPVPIPIAPFPVFPEEPIGPRPLEYNPPCLVFEDIYDACVKYVKEHRCYSSRFINQMKLTEIVNKGVFHYTLESLGEMRSSDVRTVAYKGGPVDGPENGSPPNVWDMTVAAPDSFKDCDAYRQIPHTEDVRICYKCNGLGRVTCSSCSGIGSQSCWSCSGSGRNSERNQCSSCGGRGRRTCISCSGNGKIQCYTCSGYGKVKRYLVLIVTWKNHFIDFTTDIGRLPMDRLRKAEGTRLLFDQGPKLHPITNAPEEYVNLTSERLLRTHETAFPNELIIRQRHNLRAVPFTKVKYSWKETEGEFYVYGNDRRVYFEAYPQQCCCCPCC